MGPSILLHNKLYIEAHLPPIIPPYKYLRFFPTNSKYFKTLPKKHVKKINPGLMMHHVKGPYV